MNDRFRRPDSLPPMQAVFVFEAAARLSSFTAAARELGSTQPAVSQRIVQLETDLGVPLFERSHRGVRLTADGVHLFEAVKKSLDEIRHAAADIRIRTAHGTLTILTDFGFATYWLMPRLAEFKRAVPGVNVKIVTSQEGFDPERDRADIAIAFGSGDWSPYRSTRLFPEQVMPVCTPAFRNAHPEIASPADLRELPLLHVQATHPERWLDWKGWFAAQSLGAPPEDQGMTFNSYALVIHAALSHQGVALGWVPLIDELVATGQLVRVAEPPVVTERGYFLVCPAARPEAPAAPAFRRWLLSACGASATAPAY